MRANKSPKTGRISLAAKPRSSNRECYSIRLGGSFSLSVLMYQFEAVGVLDPVYDCADVFPSCLVSCSGHRGNGSGRARTWRSSLMVCLVNCRS